MGLFSRLFSKVYDVRDLTEDELNTLVIFFQNGWGLEARRYVNMETPFDAMVDKGIVKGLRKGCLTEEELDTVIALVKVDQGRHPEDEDGKRILRELEYIRNNDVLYVD